MASHVVNVTIERGPEAGEDSEFSIARVKHGTVEVFRAPVQFSIVRPGETILPEDAPVTLVAAE
jgi:fumarate reductase flavoprotein subunit